MRLRTGVFFAASILLASGCIAVWRVDDSKPKDFELLFQTRMADGHAPGAWGMLIKDGKVIKTVTYGYRDVATKTPIQPSTYMHLGSVGKMFTAACIMKLVDDRKIRLNDSITSIFPTAPDSWKAIQIKHLLYQTSGLPDYLDLHSLQLDREYNEADMMAHIEQLEPEFLPGSAWGYSNTNYLLLGVLIHRVSGFTYAAYLKQKVLEPAGVKAVFSEGDTPSGAILSKGYFVADPRLSGHAVSKSMGTIADGCLWGNVEGLTQWDKALDEMTRLPKGLKDLFWTAVVLPSGTSTEYGAGWSVETYNGSTVYWHNGYWQGFSTFYARFPKEHVSIALCINGGDVDCDQVGFELVDPYLAGK